MICQCCGNGMEVGDKIYLSKSINGTFCSEECRNKKEE